MQHQRDENMTRRQTTTPIIAACAIHAATVAAVVAATVAATRASRRL